MPFVDEVVARLRSGDSFVISGPRATGKTTVLRRVTDRLSGDGAEVKFMNIAELSAGTADEIASNEARGSNTVYVLDEFDRASPETRRLIQGIARSDRSVLLASTDDSAASDFGLPTVALPAVELQEFLDEAFASGGHRASGIVEKLLRFTDGHPLRTMQIAHHVWEHLVRGLPLDGALDAAMREVRTSADEGFKSAWRQHSRNDHRVLTALATSPHPLFSQETLERFDLSKSSASRARARLASDGLVHRAADGQFRITDPLFADWIKRREAPAVAPSVRRAESRPGLPPFGDPDGARADLESVIAGYVPMTLLRGGGSDAGTSMTTRVIAGRKGAGKTLLLRRLQASAAADVSVYADVISSTTPMTSEVVRIATAGPEMPVVELWSALWRAAILRSAASHVLHAYALTRSVAPDARARLQDLHRQVGGRSSVPRSVGAELRDLLAETPSVRALQRGLQRYEWDDLHYVLGDLLRELPPICLYLDALDEEFAHSPKHWQDCQVGLVHAVLRLLRDPRLGSRLHVTVTVRDVVLSAILWSEHGTRYAGDPHIETLDWDEPMIRRFIREKLRRLPEAPESVADWLGFSRLPSPDGGAVDVETYLIQHTRLLPRDVTMLGNFLHTQVVDAERRGESITAKAVRAAALHTARSAGIEELALVGNELAAEMMPRDAVDHGYAEVYAGGEPLSRELGRLLTQGLRQLGAATLSEAALREFEEALGVSGSDVLSVLWRHRLLGFRVHDHDQFRSADLDDLTLPSGHGAYVLHPVLLAALT